MSMVFTEAVTQVGFGQPKAWSTGFSGLSIVKFPEKSGHKKLVIRDDCVDHGVIF